LTYPSGAPDEFISKTKYRTHLDLKWINFKAILKK
jgi:hypothetical protein